MREQLKGAPKVKSSESVIRREGVSDYDWFKKKLAAMGSYYEIERDYGWKGDNPFIPGPCGDGSGGHGGNCDFNDDFNNDFDVCDESSGTTCGSFGSAFNNSFDNCENHGEATCGSFSSAFNDSFDNCPGGGEDSGSFNISYDRRSYDVYSTSIR